MDNIVRKRIENVVKLLFAIGLIIFLVNYVDPDKIVSTFKKADFWYLSLAIILLPVNLLFQFAKWKLLCQKYFSIYNNKSIWLSIFYGISGGIFTPMKSGEYFIRSLPLRGVKIVDVVIATAVDKVIPIFFVLIIGGPFFIIFFKDIFNLSNFTILIIIALYLISLILSIFLLFGNSIISIRLRGAVRKVSLFNKIFDKVAFIKRLDKVTLIKVIFISLLFHLTFTIQMTLLLSAYSGEFNFITFFFIANIIIFIQIVIPPIALGELGIREGAAVYLIHSLGYSSAIGFNAAFSLFTINLLIPSIVGLLLLSKRN
ncbi:MAG: lysylphosphatidylglycerol synthase transmembrane domain-containing protein [Bacteroidota bacterium]